MDVLLKYEGKLADDHELDFYDAARALAGFQRSLALTTHLVLNGEIITQAPSLKNARIIVTTPQPWSWEVIASIIGGAWVLGTATKDSPLGHLLYSVYDYVVSQALGFPVDYNKSLYQQYKQELKRRQSLRPSWTASLRKWKEALPRCTVPSSRRRLLTMQICMLGELPTPGYGLVKN